MCDETIEERQDNEFAVLQSIYGEDVVDNRETVAWKIWRPLDLMLTLHPLHNSDVKGIHCSVTLHIKCCASYPNKSPSLAIHKIHGVSTENGNRLLKELEELASKLCGEVCIFQLAQHVQQFLCDHNKPILSFYDEMVKQKNEQEKLKLHYMKVKEEEERQKIKDEIQKRQKMLTGAGRQHTRSSSNNQEQDCLDGRGDSPELVYYADDKASPAKKVTRWRTVEVPCTCKNKLVNIIRVTQRNNRKVYIGNCLGHSSNGSTTYLAIDDDGERLIAKRWILPPATDFKTRQKQLISIQTDLKIISILTNDSLVPYIAMEICKDVSKKMNKQEIFLFRNFVLGTSLKFITKKLYGFSEQYEGLKLLRHVGLGVLSALKDLHSRGLAHRDVRTENVYLDDFGKVKLVGIDLDMRLSEMLSGDSLCDRQPSAQDIYATGQLLLSILIQERAYFDVPPDLPTTAKDFFARCLTEDEHTQWSAEQLLNHAFLVDAPAKLTVNKEKKDTSSGSEDDEAIKNIHRYNPVAHGQTRLYQDYEVLSWIGKGAFGDVLKVKNKLDGGVYAIKRIKLNPENVQLNKKITREVKLLSRLSNEHVVRYNNAWIESTIEQEEIDNSVESKAPSIKKPDNLRGTTKLSQEVKVEWSISEKPVQERIASSDIDDSDEDDEPDPWINVARPEKESSSGIVFEAGSTHSQTIPSEDVVDATVTSTKRERVHKVLYILMEYCEKHTLRHAIDQGLYRESYRAWRFFREIVTGLAHVHQRGMIHRDLKPVNIFVNSYDHVKIGDFGLATKAFTAMSVDEKTKPEEIGGSLTGQVGTALYVAPEIVQTSAKVAYSQKVDIYSLGIILFEMFHPPLNTAMERILVLTKLRSKEIILPKDFEKQNEKHIHVIRWLLNHEPSLRPTCTELLSSEHVPRTFPLRELSGLLSHGLGDRSSRSYKRLIDACLDQRQSVAEDFIYHNIIYKKKPLKLLSNFKQAVLKIFISHGASEFYSPLLTPRVQRWGKRNNAMKVMTSSGFVCHLPRDLRLPFARHTAYTGTKYMRRYVIDRVYREHEVQLHPEEIIDCAFDIVTPETDSLWSDAELLVVASRAAMACNLKVIIKLNHTELLKTLLISCGVPLEKHEEIYNVLVDVSLGKTKRPQLQTILSSFGVTEHDQSPTCRLLLNDVGVHEVREQVSPLVKEARWSRAVDVCVNILEALCRNAKALGCECPLTVAPFLAYNATQHRGIFWRMFVVDTTTAKRKSKNVIAAGGRYDPLVEEFCKLPKTAKDHHNTELSTTSVGFSMSLEVMAKIMADFLTEIESEIPLPMKSLESTLICVCLWGTAGNGRGGQAATRRAQLARDLWAAGFNCCTWTGCISDAHELSRARLVLKEDDAGTRVVCWDGTRNHTVPYIDLLDFVKQKLNPDSVRSPESTSKTVNWCESEKSNSFSTAVTFITSTDRMTKNSKRNCESQITTRITGILLNLGLQPIFSKIRVNVLALSCEGACVRMLAAQLSAPLDHEDLERAFSPVYDAFPKWRSILDDTLNELFSLMKQNNQSRSTEEVQMFALYSIPDLLCRLIT